MEGEENSSLSLEGLRKISLQSSARGMTLLPSLHLDAGTCLGDHHCTLAHGRGGKRNQGAFSPLPKTYPVLSLTWLLIGGRLVASDNDLQDPSVGHSLFVLLFP